MRWTKIVTRSESQQDYKWQQAARACGAHLVAAASDAHLIDCLERNAPECAVALAVDRLDTESLRLVERIRDIDRSCPVVVLTSPAAAERVVLAMRSGVSDILARDASAEAIVESLGRLAGDRWAPEALASEGPALEGGGRLIGHGPAVEEIRRQIARLARSEANVLITGESGTGKELVAELIHCNSRRRAAPFVAVNCAAIPDALLESELFGHERGAFTGAVATRDGKLQAAREGTLFLDEIGDMSLVAQAKILRAIENRVVQRLGSNVDNPVRFRVVAATNQSLEELTREKRFRQDLYFRLNVVRLELPPLRERLEDIPELAEYFLREFARRQNEPARRLEPDVLQRLQRHSWPGNVRELRNVLESMQVYSSARSIRLNGMPEHILKTLSMASPHPDERTRILSALSSAGWNRDQTSEILHCSRMTLYRKMRRYAISPARPAGVADRARIIA